MKNAVLSLKFYLKNKINLIILFWMVCYSLTSFKVSLNYGDDINFTVVNLGVLNNIRAMIFYFSLTFIVILYFYLYDKKFNILNICRFYSKWDFYKNNVKKIFVVTVFFMLSVFFVLLLISLSVINNSISEYVKSIMNSPLEQSALSMNPILVIFLNYILVGTFLFSLGIIFLNLSSVIKYKEWISVGILITLAIHKSLFYNDILDKGNLTFLNSALLIHEFKGSNILTAFLVKFSYLLIVIFINLLIGKFICTGFKINLFQNIKKINISLILIYFIGCITLLSIFIFSKEQLETFNQVLIRIFKAPNKNIFNISIFMIYHLTLVLIIGKIVYKEMGKIFIFYINRSKSLKKYFVNLASTIFFVVLIYYLLTLSIVLLFSKFKGVEIQINLITLFIIGKSFLMSTIFILAEIIGLLIFKVEWLGIMFMISLIWINNFMFLLNKNIELVYYSEKIYLLNYKDSLFLSIFIMIMLSFIYVFIKNKDINYISK